MEKMPALRRLPWWITMRRDVWDRLGADPKSFKLCHLPLAIIGMLHHLRGAPSDVRGLFREVVTLTAAIVDTATGCGGHAPMLQFSRELPSTAQSRYEYPVLSLDLSVDHPIRDVLMSNRSPRTADPTYHPF